jgi:hypothetical protein
MSINEHLYVQDETADISSTGVLLTLDTEDRPHVSAVLYHADANADYLVECSDTDSSSNEDWDTLADNDATQSLRFEGRGPERYVRVRVDTAAGSTDTADVSIQATA